MLISYTNGQTSVILRVKLRQDTTGSKPGNGITALTGSSSGLIIGTIADTEASSTAYTAAGSTIQTIATLGTYAAPSSSDCRFAQVDATNHAGVYEIQLANARFAVSNAKSLLVSITGVSGMSDCDVCVPLQAVNPYDGVHGGMTAIPNALPGANGGLFIAGTNDHCTITNNLLVSGTTTLTGNVLLSGTLTVSGAVAFSSTFAVTTSTSLAALSCTTLTASGAVALQSTVTVTGAVLFSSTFATTGTTTFNAFTVTNATTLTGAVSLGSTLGVTGTTTLNALTVTNNLLVSGNATVSGTTTLTGAVSLGSTLGVTGTTTFAAVACTTLASSGTVTFNAFTCTHNFTVSGNWLTTGTTTWTGAVSANGGVTFQSSSGAGMIIISTSSGSSGLEIGGSAAADIALVGTGLFSADIYGRLLGNTGVSSDSIAGVGAQVDLQTIKGEAVTCAGGVTIPAATLASTTNITAGTIATVTNQLTAAAIATGVWTDTTSGDFTTGSSPGKILVAQLGGAFTSSSSSIFTVGALANAPTGGSAPTAAAIATAVWQDTTAGDFTTASSIGKSLYNAFTAGTSVFTVAALANAPTGGSAPTASQIATAVWEDLTAGGDFGTAGSIGKLFVTTGLTIAGISGVTFPTNFSALGISIGGHISNVDTLTTYTGNTLQTANVATLITTVGVAGAGLTSLAPAATALSTAVWTSTIAGYITGPVALESEAVLIYNRLGAPAGASVSADIAALEVGVNVSAINSVSTSNVAAVNAYVGTANSLVNTAGKLWVLDGNGNPIAPASTALSTAVWTGVPTGFLAATFPSGTIANTTNINGGTISNLTNAPTVGDFTATMKASIGTAVAASAVASVTGNVGGNVVGSVGSVIATVSANLVSILGTALTETTGYLAAAFKKFFNIATPTLTTASVNQSGDSYPIVDSGTYGNAALLTAIGSASAPTVAQIVTGIFTDTTSGDFTTVGSPGYLLMHQLENAFNSSTSSIFTISALSNAPGGSGTGPGVINVLVTVTDGTNPLQNVLVRMFLNNSNDVTLATNASGQVAFTLTAATWKVSMYLPGYIFTPTTLAVSSDITPTYAMTALSFAPSPPGTTTGVLYTYDDEMVIQTGIVVTCKIKVLPPALSGIAVSTTAQSITSDDTGLCQFAGLIPGATYILSRGNQTRTVTIPASAGSTYELPGLIGTP